MNSPRNTIDSILQKRKILITCGTGGVGKTTLSAAIALRAAMQGKRTVVITIDPAKRLATSLGIELQDHPTDITTHLLDAMKKNRTSSKGPVGRIDAIVPDTRKTFENFIHDLSPNPGVAERVMRNPIFHIFAKEFSGTNEYMALEKLYAIEKTHPYDCIILDTPPSRNTLAFLDAPGLLAQFFEERLIRWLVLPANKIVSTGMRKALGVLEKLTGAGFMTSLFDFASALFEIRARFTANLKEITHLLQSNQVGFLMVTAPSPDTAPEAAHFMERLRSRKLNFDGIAVNRTLGYLELGDTEAFPAARELLRALQARERRALEKLRHDKNTRICATVPEFARDVHSVEDLFHVALALS